MPNSLKAWTDYPFTWLGDKGGEEAPVREVEVFEYDDNKYCRVRVCGGVDEVKAGYLYQAPGRLGEVPPILLSQLAPLVPCKRSEQAGVAPSYDIQQHNHRFAAWAAGRAANVKGCRFSVEEAKSILEMAGIDLVGNSPDELPDPTRTNESHRVWREAVISAAGSLGLPFSHGVAAKLINVYLKARLVCGGHSDNAKVAALHPPIDSVLLDELAALNFGDNKKLWNSARRTRWSHFNSEQYENVINGISAALKGGAMWEVEQYWRGHQ